MRGHFAPVRFIFVCLIVSVIAGCSVQRPDSALDSYYGSKVKQLISKASAYPEPRLEKEPVRVDYLTLASAITNPQIFIYKEKRRLYVVQSDVVVRDYPITLGLQPVGNKHSANDGRTPVGNFHICRKTPGERSSDVLFIDYPDRRDAKRALFSGVISPLQFKEIQLAFQLKTLPPWDTKLGGQVCIDAEDGQQNRAHGDIELYSSDMKELFKVASIGTPVHIRP